MRLVMLYLFSAPLLLENYIPQTVHFALFLLPPQLTLRHWSSWTLNVAHSPHLAPLPSTHPTRVILANHMLPYCTKWRMDRRSRPTEDINALRVSHKGHQRTALGWRSRPTEDMSALSVSQYLNPSPLCLPQSNSPRYAACSVLALKCLLHVSLRTFCICTHASDYSLILLCSGRSLA